MQRLKGKIAVVTGASRGAGRGIALALGEEGATVYVTGRSVRNEGAPSDLSSLTINATADAITARGGLGIPVQCDHTDDEQVAALFHRVEEEQEGLDLLVNNAWGGYEDMDDTFASPFWEQPLKRWDRMFDAGVRAQFTASRLAAALMIPKRSGLIVGTTFWDRGKCLGNLPYDLAKTAVNRMTYVMGLELREHGIAAIAVSPGWMRTEAVLKHFDLPLDDSASALPKELETTESVFYVGRAIAALAADPNVLEKTGTVCTVGDLAREYEFTDIDGTQPPPFQIPDEPPAGLAD
jgi:NAD(P)-dependent dehydrogenase (short-subunit alcohol dehydrogenase family)